LFQHLPDGACYLRGVYLLHHNRVVVRAMHNDVLPNGGQPVRQRFVQRREAETGSNREGFIRRVGAQDEE
jgi:hypothetical protein